MIKVIRGSIIFFLIAAVMMTCIPCMAAGTSTTIDATLNTINVKVNGSAVQADNILYDNTTYIPLRTVAEMLNKDVGWDSNTNTASINNRTVAKMAVKNMSVQSGSKRIISYDFGHMEGGRDTSASGILYEYNVVRDYGSACIRYLEREGYTCINCTPPNGDMSLSNSLAYRVDKANESGSQLHLCFHANCFYGQAHGAEIEVASDSGEAIAGPVLNKICSLGFTYRGIKRPNLYVTKYTDMVCLLIEPFFIDNEGDVSIYDSEKLGKAIAEGIVGYDITEGSKGNTINVIINGINIKVNGQAVAANNLLYNNTTYVPLRKVAEMLNKSVAWDANTRTASIN